MSDRHALPARPTRVPGDASPLPARTGPSRRALLAATAVGVPVAAALGGAPAAADPARPADPADPAVTGGETRILDIPLADAPLVEAEGTEVRELAQQPATMVGVTWPADVEAPEVQARGLLAEDGGWSPWCPLEPAEDPETGELATGTEVAWMGDVTGLQIRAELDGSDVSEVLTAHVVTTSQAALDEQVDQLEEEAGTEPQQQPALRSASTAANPATPALGPGAPSYVSRASWGADESVVRGTRGAERLKAVVIHHSAGTNDYSATQSAQILRGIHAYHTRTLGWADIGYNLLVDRYGRIFEGRSGGLHRSIIGAHAYGFNTGSFGVCVMGDHTARTVPAATRTALSRIVAWKLLSTFTTSTSVAASWTPGSGTRFPAGTPVSLPVVLGHRDVNYTECPGRSLYDQLGTIRREAQGYLDSGWREHLLAFEGAGGGAALGTVVKGAHRTGGYTATVLTSGLVLQESGDARGYATPMAAQWRASWGRPSSAAFTRETQTVQRFEQGAAVEMGGRVVFHDSRFIDVPPDLMFRAEIEQLAARGITTGWPDGTYRPLSPIQRDAMAVFIYRSMGSPSFSPPSRSPFRDMPRDRMYYREITWAHAQGIVEGWPDGTFRPTASIERGALAAFLYRASGKPASGTSSPFRDVPSNHQFAREITWLADTGITTGWPDGTFRPRAPIGRDAMAAFMIRWMEHRGI
ncbi:S-layer homology domain-containing protein [Brachybacterium sp. YJGR34]|uniref:S-layer homology domain-containing protein n=1 Tax=Brachybacterium sp. YJGR34 TaxID=2059911 RepID=UPI000E0A6612|nr:S-layer homology domain-containing protein [Brachybacterium sp. YJGR34]